MTDSVPDERPVTLDARDDLDDLVASRERVLVMFRTTGCGICESMEPVLDGVARTTDVAVAVMNPRDDPGLVDEYDVRSVPKLLLFEDGDLVETREEGFLPVEDVTAFVDRTGDGD